ncbi:MAG TPA: hypothetical protein VI456_02385 [Polyangia bacterium]
MTAARQLHAALLLPSALVENGQVLLAGGNSGTATLGSAELWNGTSTWTATSALPAAVQAETATIHVATLSKMGCDQFQAGG